jgi:hypothetical protein
VAKGRVESGILKQVMVVKVTPGNLTAKVKSLDEALSEARQVISLALMSICYCVETSGRNKTGLYACRVTAQVACKYAEFLVRIDRRSGKILE